MNKSMKGEKEDRKNKTKIGRKAIDQEGREDEMRGMIKQTRDKDRKGRDYSTAFD